jgi:hypothetical protein
MSIEMQVLIVWSFYATGAFTGWMGARAAYKE